MTGVADAHGGDAPETAATRVADALATPRGARYGRRHLAPIRWCPTSALDGGGPATDALVARVRPSAAATLPGLARLTWHEFNAIRTRANVQIRQNPPDESPPREAPHLALFGLLEARQVCADHVRHLIRRQVPVMPRHHAAVAVTQRLGHKQERHSLLDQVRGIRVAPISLEI